MTQDAYRPPQTELVEPRAAESGDLAKRSTRFWASMIDGAISLVIFLPVLWGLGVFEGFPNIQPMSAGMTALTGVLGLGVSIALHGWLVAKRGQTIGKAVLGIRMVRSDGSPLDFQRWLVRRVLPLSAVGQIPVANQILPLVDVLFIFRADRRCVHDLIADTIVVNAR